MSEPTLRIYIKNGDIAGSLFSKRWMFSQENFDDFMKRYLVKEHT